MLKIAFAVLLAGTALAVLPPAAGAESLACQTVNGKTVCLRGNGSLSCRTVDGQTICREGSDAPSCRTAGDRTDCSSDPDRPPHPLPLPDPFAVPMPMVPMPLVPMPAIPNGGLSMEQDGNGLRIRAGGLDLRIE